MLLTPTLTQGGYITTKEAATLSDSNTTELLQQKEQWWLLH